MVACQSSTIARPRESSMFEAFGISTLVVAVGEIGDKTQLLALVLRGLGQVQKVAFCPRDALQEVVDGVAPVCVCVCVCLYTRV